MNAHEARELADNKNNIIIVMNLLTSVYKSVALAGSKRQYSVTHVFNNEDTLFGKTDVLDVINILRSQGYSVDMCGDYLSSDNNYITSTIQLAW